MIRDYAPGHLEGLLDTWYAASLLAHPFLSEAFLAEERQTIEDVYLALARTWVYIEAGQVQGFVSLIGDEVGAIFVRPERQGEGIGRALLDRARLGHASLDVEVFEANPGGRAFYTAYGFEPVGRRIHQATGQPLLRLRLAS
ncbi:MAG: GNAT family N-acetyltransferase [Chloroflexi bacterium]|nr:GNAT family N-acetyltransferase [Chloroflexota bacterium]